MRHEGFSLVEVLSPCVTQNKMDTYEWFKRNIYKLEEEKGYDPFDKKQALERVLSSAKIPVGLIYQEQKPSYEKLILPDRKKPVAFGNLNIDRGKFEEILREFR